ncbi:MAG: hypothetical protein H0W08_11185 [Acidobacteria bacterium]|nr:hypothetical protein [Acidobacteriota bacterium]
MSRFHATDSWVYDRGVLWDSGINAISILTALLPSPERMKVVAATAVVPPGATSESRAMLDIALGNATGRLSFRSDWTGPEARAISVSTDGCNVHIDITRDALVVDGTTRQSNTGGMAGEYERMFAEFAKRLHTRESLARPMEIALIEDAHRLMKAVNHSNGENTNARHGG